MPTITRLQAIKNIFLRMFKAGYRSFETATDQFSQELKDVFPPTSYGDGSPPAGTDGVSQVGDLYIDRTNGAMWIYTSTGWLSNSDNGAVVPATVSTGIMLPMYEYPADIFNNVHYNALIELKKQYPQVPLTVILNCGWGTGGAAGGPGSVVDGNFTQAVKMLRGAGAVVIGYVSTNYSIRAEAEVTADIDLWKSLYPEINGIFFDEMSNDWIANVDAPETDPAWPKVLKYQGYSAYAKTKSLPLCVGNPGADTPEVWFRYNVMDVIVVYENQDYPSPTNPVMTLEALRGGAWPGSHRDYPTSTRSALIYNVPTYSDAETLDVAKYVGSMYVTEQYMVGGFLNPWSSLSAHIALLFETLSRSITSGQLTDGLNTRALVDFSNVTPLAVTEGLINSAAVTAAKIAMGAITPEKLDILIGGGNLVSNSSFEADSNADGLADDWLVYDNTPISPAFTRITGRLRGYAQQLAWTTAPSGSLGIMREYAVPNGWKPNSDYAVSFWAKAPSGVQVSVPSLQWNTWPATTTWVAHPTLTSSWQRYIAIVHWGASVEGVGRLYLDATTGAYFANANVAFDDVQVEEGNVVTGYAPASSELLPGTITETMITEGAVSTPKLAANSVTAAKMVISNFANFWPNGNSEVHPPTGHYSATPWTDVEFGYWSDHGSGAGSKRYVRDLLSSSQLYSDISAKPGEYFKLYADVYGVSGGGHTLEVKFLDSSGSDLGSGQTFTTSFGSVWQSVETDIAGPAPTDTVYVRARLSTTGQAWFDNINLNKVSDGQLIVQGSIGAREIAAESITAKNLLVADFDNLWPNSLGTDVGKPAGWVATGNGLGDQEWQFAQATVGSPTGFSHHLAAGATELNPWVRIQVKGLDSIGRGDEYHFEANCKHVMSGSNGGGLAAVWQTLSGGVYTSGPAFYAGCGTSYAVKELNVTYPSTGGPYTHLYCYLFAQPGVTADFTNVYLRRKNNGSLIVEGTIKALHMEANSYSTSDFSIYSGNNSSVDGLPATGVKMMAVNDVPDAYSSGTTYTWGSLVTYGGQMYRSINGSHSNNTPSTVYPYKTAYWMVYAPLQVGRVGVQIGTALLDDVTLNSINGMGRGSSAVSVFYRGGNDPLLNGGAPVLMDAPWTRTTTYAVGDRVAADPVTGGTYPIIITQSAAAGDATRIYTCTQAGTTGGGGSGPTGTTTQANWSNDGPHWTYTEAIGDAERLSIYAYRPKAFASSGYAYRFRFTLQPRGRDNLDAMRYIKITPFTNAGGAPADFPVFYAAVPDRLHYDVDVDTGSGNAVFWEANVTAETLINTGTGFNGYLRVQTFNVSGPSRERDWDFTARSAPGTGVAGEYSTLGSIGGGGGGGGGGGKYVP